MTRVRRLGLSLAIGGGIALSVALVGAQSHDGHDHGPPAGATPPARRQQPPQLEAPPGRPMPRPGVPPQGMPAGHGMPPGHGMPAGPGVPAGHGMPAGHGAPSGHTGGIVHELPRINWNMGLLGEKAGIERSDLLWRKKGMPVPFLAVLINFSILAYALMHYGEKPLREALKKRRDDLMSDMDEAARIRDESEQRLAEYEDKLEQLDDEVTRIKTDYAEQATRDEARIVREARTRREKLRADAELLVSQEQKALHEELLQATVARASKAAEELVKTRLSAADHDRLADEYLKDLSAAKGLGFGGAR